MCVGVSHNVTARVSSAAASGASTGQGNDDGQGADLSLPPAAPIPRIRLRIKTRIKRMRVLSKSFAPREFSGYIGSGRNKAHATHSLAGGRGVVWCWKCGKIAVNKPRGLVNKCTEVPSKYGAATLRRLRKGQPPYGLKDWPTGDDCFFRQLVVGTAEAE